MDSPLADAQIGPISAIDFSPAGIISRRFDTWPGLKVETVEVVRRSPFEYRFRAPCHLLIAAEIGERESGETLLEGLPRSDLRTFSRKMTFVPAGRDFAGSQKPRLLTRMICIYLDPRGPLTDPELRFSEVEFRPRLFFEDGCLWQTALKLKAQVEHQDVMHRQYGEALGILLAHDLVRSNANANPIRSPAVRGGLAAWQQRRLAEYIEDHVSDDIPLTALAQLVELSPYHLCRTFRRSFGVPPQKYHAMRRIERAKQMLAERELSITMIAQAIGFGESSTFSSAFRRLTGQTPSRYRRDLD
ncbi:AraC family transcriptional regulator [uncultured Bradyrhizobium sp.]|uniref:helix-turn-helix domain-containing protein n=1 Tax=Bradyrhizobium sp. TaxID=376 RepID=UPI00260CC2DC|nr:AraC family transcriptional regulator [uncultured Bradyrhizobium sp.]